MSLILSLKASSFVTDLVRAETTKEVGFSKKKDQETALNLRKPYSTGKGQVFRGNLTLYS